MQVLRMSMPTDRGVSSICSRVTSETVKNTIADRVGASLHGKLTPDKQGFGQLCRLAGGAQGAYPDTALEMSNGLGEHPVCVRSTVRVFRKRSQLGCSLLTRVRVNIAYLVFLAAG